MEQLISPLAITLYCLCALGLLWLTARTVSTIVSGDDPTFSDTEATIEQEQRVGNSRQLSSNTFMLSKRVKTLALENQQIEACKALMEESGVSLTVAKQAIDDFIASTR
jgi:hypothetical protein